MFSWISLVLSPYGPPGKADLTWGLFVKVVFLGKEKFDFRTFSSYGTPNLESTNPEL